MRSGLLLASSLLSLAALVSCGTSSDPLAQDPVVGGVGASVDEPVFGSGSEDELELAENLSYEVLYGATSPALAKGVDSLRTTRVKLDDLGMARTRVQQLVNGVPVKDWLNPRNELYRERGFARAAPTADDAIALAGVHNNLIRRPVFVVGGVARFGEKAEAAIERARA